MSYVRPRFRVVAPGKQLSVFAASNYQHSCSEKSQMQASPHTDAVKTCGSSLKHQADRGSSRRVRDASGDGIAEPAVAEAEWKAHAADVDVGFE